MSHLSAGMPGVCDQLQKVCLNPYKAGRIPGFSAEFRFGDPKTTPGEDKGYSTGCTNLLKPGPSMARELSWLLGKLNAATRAIPQAPLFYRSL